MDANPSVRQQIAAWATPERKGQFAALAASRGLSESKLLRLLIDSVLERNAVDLTGDERHAEAGKGDRITLRLRSGDGKWLRLRARRRGMKYTTYAAALIRAHVRVDPPMPLEELARLERGLAEVSALGRHLSQIARRISEGQGVDPLRLELTAVLDAVEELRQTLREVVRVNRISWESADAEAR
jgi:predicted DNA binding CopG/RHH family protein